VVAAVLSAAVAFLPAPTAAQVAGQRTDYKGWKNNLRLANGDAELVITLDVGPRIISYRLKDGRNVFKEYDAQLGKSDEPDWQIRGGHRLWVAPEDTTRTYFPDNRPVALEELAAGAVRLLPPPEKEHGLQKEMDVRLAERGSRVTVTHRLRNIGTGPLELAPWALTVMAPGGVEIIPLPPKKPHPSSVTDPGFKPVPADFWPNQTLVLWPFFDFKDRRYTFGSKYITLRHDAALGPTKIGLAHQQGWVAYLNAGTLFLKRFDYQAGRTYPDRGCNFETFANQDMLEVETLGPLVRLKPAESVEHVETWELVPNVDDVRDEAAIDRQVLAKVK
jgi:hypothetical protein